MSFLDPAPHQVQSAPAGTVALPVPATSAGLTIVANVEISTGPALVGATQPFVLNLVLLYARVDIRI